VNYALVNTSTGATISSGQGCSAHRISSAPAGSYKVAVTDNGQTGAYTVYLALTPPPDSFNVTLPVSISNGAPSAGAGNLETTSSEDDYTFSATSKGSRQINFSSCSSTLSSVKWALIDTKSGATVASGKGCTTQTLSNVASGSYFVAVTDNGASGTYKLYLG
jgi:hypothetical protein